MMIGRKTIRVASKPKCAGYNSDVEKLLNRIETYIGMHNFKVSSAVLEIYISESEDLTLLKAMHKWAEECLSEQRSGSKSNTARFHINIYDTSQKLRLTYELSDVTPICINELDINTINCVEDLDMTLRFHFSKCELIECN